MTSMEPPDAAALGVTRAESKPNGKHAAGERGGASVAPRKPVPEYIARKADRAEARSAGKDPFAAERAEVAFDVPAGDDEAEIKRLAKLPRLEYDRSREAVAKRLGIRVTTLDREVEHARGESAPERAGLFDPVEPWSEPVNGKSLVAEIEAAINRYVIMPQYGATAAALWAIHAHALNCAQISPILAIESPTKRCGKTRLLDVLNKLVPKPLVAANLTGAVVFRAVDKFTPTLMVDEADTFMTPDKAELIGVLNSSHARASAQIPRCVGDKHEIRLFSTWCAKAMACIKHLPSTLQDRSIAIPMRRKEKGETVARLRIDRVAELIELCRKVARWVQDNASALTACDPPIPEALHDRAADNWRPLLAIADTIGGEWPARAREAAEGLSGINKDDDIGVRLLEDCRIVLKTWLTPTALAEKLANIEDAPWAEFRRGDKPISTRKLAELLKPFGIEAENCRTDDDQTKRRRYQRASFMEAWKRYLQPETPN
jgi:putative DNA primase/helicase